MMRMAKAAENETGGIIYDEVVRIPARSPRAAATALLEDNAPLETASIGDVARLAGVAPITVSRALRNPEKVSAEKRARIEAAVERTGYRVNPFASALKSGRSNVVMAFASNMFSEQFALALHACANVLEEAGYLFLVGQTSYSYDRETAAIRSLQALKPAAVMFTGVIELEQNRETLRNLGIPIMETWAFPRDPIDMLVGFSNTEAGRLAAEALADGGYKKVGFIGRRGGRGALRLKGFRDSCRDLGLEFVGEFLSDEVAGPSDGRRCLSTLLESGASVDAVFCANDLLALGTLMEARRRKLSIPKDFGVIGFGESDIAAEIPPGLTTVGIDSAQLGKIVGEMLLNRLSKGEIAAPIRRVDLLVTHRGSV
ncbi:transcriptional regulator [Agrobacterium tumefaciens]|jgi:LacI family gluconate utilization system Gnt-I transcriptional repressor|nr:transcriptional regulator [Agrobacterium tumefaciens]KJX90339.1 HTH-type transcriptional repressor purR [Agrobacterium tumefaciens]